MNVNKTSNFCYEEEISMADNKKTKENEESRYPLFKITRKLLLASIGAIALAQDEIDDLVNRLVDRGQVAEEEGKALIANISEKRKNMAKKSLLNRKDNFDEIIEVLDLPTRKDLQILSNKITSLTKKVEELSKEQRSN